MTTLNPKLLGHWGELLNISFLLTRLMLVFFNRGFWRDTAGERGSPCTEASISASRRPSNSPLCSPRSTSSSLYFSGKALLYTLSLKVWISVLRAWGTLSEFLVPSWFTFIQPRSHSCFLHLLVLFPCSHFWYSFYFLTELWLIQEARWFFSPRTLERIKNWRHHVL